MKKKRYRILLHTMTFQRDFSFIYVLSKLLEKMGCECIMVNNTNLHLKIFKLWNPHAVFFVTLSHAKSIKASYPNAKLFIWAAEGGYKTISEELKILDDEYLQENIDRIYLWGEGTREAMNQKMTDLKFPHDKVEFINKKCMLAGNPRMDICRYYPENTGQDPNKIRLGLIGNFYYVNNKIYHPFPIMLDSELSEKGALHKLDVIQYQIRQLKTYCEIMTDLGTDKYEFSLRPYPLENLHNYKTLAHTKKYPFQINDSLDFSTWVMEQDVIIGATSTTLSQIAVAKKPFINVDKLCERQERQYDAVMAEGLKKHQPKTYSELLKMVKNYKNFKFDNPAIHKQLDYFYNASEQDSVICRVAKDLYDNLSDLPKISSFLNKGSVLCFDDLWSTYIEWRSADELRENYTYFRRSCITPKADAEFAKVIDVIVSEHLSIFE